MMLPFSQVAVRRRDSLTAPSQIRAAARDSDADQGLLDERIG